MEQTVINQTWESNIRFYNTYIIHTTATTMTREVIPPTKLLSDDDPDVRHDFRFEV